MTKVWVQEEAPLDLLTLRKSFLLQQTKGPRFGSSSGHSPGAPGSGPWSELWQEVGGHVPVSTSLPPTWEDAAEPGGMQPPAVPSTVFGKTRGKRQRLSRQAWATSDSGELISAGGPARRKRYFEARVESRASVLEHKTPFFPGNSSAPRSAVEAHRPGEILGDNTGGVKGAAEPPAELRAGSASRGAGVGGADVAGALSACASSPHLPLPPATSRSSVNNPTRNNGVL